MILARFADAREAARALAEQVLGALQGGLASRNVAGLALPGGRTPLPLFEALREASLDWSRVGVTLTDERWVPQSDPSSNAAQLRSALLHGAAGAARFEPLYRDTPGAADAAAAVWQDLHTLGWPLDAVVLGMGEDGHFASLFPGNTDLPAALDPAGVPGCVAMQAPAAPRDRLSLNLAALRSTRRLFVLVSGAAKRELLLRAARRDARSPAVPIAALLALRQPLPEIYWSA